MTTEQKAMEDSAIDVFAHRRYQVMKSVMPKCICIDDHNFECPKHGSLAWESAYLLGRASLAKEVPTKDMRGAAGACDAMGYFRLAESLESFLSTVEELRK